MDMRDALIEVKEFSNDNDELNESLLGLSLKVSKSSRES